MVGFRGGHAGRRVAVLRVEGDAGGAVGVNGQEAADAVPEGGGAEGVFLGRAGVSGVGWGEREGGNGRREHGGAERIRER